MVSPQTLQDRFEILVEKAPRRCVVDPMGELDQAGGVSTARVTSSSVFDAIQIKIAGFVIDGPIRILRRWLAGWIENVRVVLAQGKLPPFSASCSKGRERVKRVRSRVWCMGIGPRSNEETTRL